jgi:hypothetical protein
MSFDDHLAKVRAAPKQFDHAGFSGIVRKYFFAKAELKYLMYLLTLQEIQPGPTKVKAIRRLLTDIP